MLHSSHFILAGSTEAENYVENNDIMTKMSGNITWASLPRKDQLAILCIIRIAEPILRISFYVGSHFLAILASGTPNYEFHL